MAEDCSTGNPPLAQEVVLSRQYVENLNPVANTLFLPRAPIGKYWEGKLRTPDLGRLPHPLSTGFQQKCGTQYRGTAEATGIAYAGAIHDTNNGHCPTFRVKIAHPLSQCLQYYRHSAGGKVWILKSKIDQFTMPGSPGDPFKGSSKDVQPRTISKPGAGGGMMSTGFVKSQFPRVDHRIVQLVHRILPSMPHQLSVPTRNPYLTQFPYENLNNPFEEWEVKPLQYMTLVASGTRGVAWVKGDWGDESPHSVAISRVATPQSERDPNKPPPVKITMADYKAGKRPPSSSQTKRPIPQEAPQGGQNGENRPSQSPTQQMIDQIVQGNANPLDRLREPIPPPDISRPYMEPPKAPDSPPFNWDPDPLPSKTLSKPVGQKEKGRAIWPAVKEEPDWKRMLLAGQATRPKPGNHSSQGPQQPKRPLDANEPSSAEKRVKLTNPPPSKAQESTHQNSSSTSKTFPKNEQSSKNVSHVVSHEAGRNDVPKESHETAKSSSIWPIENYTLAEQNDERRVGSNRHVDPPNSMPPLLSPLPPGLISPDAHFGASNRQAVEQERSGDGGQRGSAKREEIEAENSHRSQDTKSAEPSDDDWELPPMLSPLPVWWIQQIARNKEELDRLELPPASYSINTVETRRERSRQPDAPGVARKTKTPLGSSTAANIAAGEANISKDDRKTNESTNKAKSNASRKSLIVKLKYGKRNKTTVSRILNMKARPEAGQKMLPSAAAHGSEDRYHTRPTEGHEEPSTKRSKLAGNVELQRARTPLTPSVQSPAPTATQKGTFSTPKKSDSIKSVAMRKVDSSDGRILTPQAGAASTPASVEKPKMNGTESKSTEIEGLRVTHIKYLTLGQILKRQADQILKVKEPNPGPVSDDEKKLGAVIAIEAVVAFMESYNAFDKYRHLERKQNPGDNWTQFFAFQAFAVERSRPFDKIFTVALLVGSVCHEALERVYVERILNDPSGAPPDFAEKLATVSYARAAIWNRYREACKISPVEFVISVSDAKAMATSILTEFCEENNIPWEKKLEF